MKTDLTVWGLALSMFMASLDTSIANAGLPAIAGAFGALFPAAQWVVLAYLLAITTIIVGAGRVGDLFGRRRVLLAGIGLFTAASALCGMAPSLGFLIGARAVQGVGAAVMMALTVSFAPEGRTGRTMGVLGTMSALGTTLGPSLGGLLMAGFGWRSIFLVNVPLGILNLGLAVWGLPVDQGERRGALDVPGMAMMGVTLGAYALAMTGVGGMWLLGLAGLAGISFVWVERRAAAPLVEFGAIRAPRLLGMNAMVSTVMMSTLVVGPFYLTRGLGLAVGMAGLAMSVGPLVAALMGIPAGRLVDRWGAGRVTVGGLAGMVVGCATLCLGWGLAGYLIPIGVLTASYALFHVANNSAVMTGLAGDRRGVVAGLLSLSRNLGLITGASVMGAVFGMWADVVTAGPAEVLLGMRAVFGLGAGLALGALVMARSASGGATDEGEGGEAGGDD